MCGPYSLSLLLLLLFSIYPSTIIKLLWQPAAATAAAESYIGPTLPFPFFFSLLLLPILIFFKRTECVKERDEGET